MANPLRSPRFTSGDTNSRFLKAMNNTPTIKKGESDRQAVRLLQQALIDVGIPLPLSIKQYGSPDGQFGNETHDAVKFFQRKQFPSETPDGKVGKNTLARLDDLLPYAGAPLPPLGTDLADADVEDIVEMATLAVLNVLRGAHVVDVSFVYRGQEINIGWFHLVRRHIEEGKIGIFYDPSVANSGLAIYCPDNNHGTAANCIVIPSYKMVTWKHRSILLHECVHASQDIRGIPLAPTISEGAAYIAQNLYHRLATGSRVKDTSPTADAIHEQADKFVEKILAPTPAAFHPDDIAEFDRRIAAAGYRGPAVAYDGMAT